MNVISAPAYIDITLCSYRISDQDDPVESFCGSQPRSKEAFWSRVETFSVSFYAKFQIVPVVCPKQLQKALENSYLQQSCDQCS